MAEAHGPKLLLRTAAEAHFDRVVCLETCRLFLQGMFAGFAGTSRCDILRIFVASGEGGMFTVDCSGSRSPTPASPRFDILLL